MSAAPAEMIDYDIPRVRSIVSGLHEMENFIIIIVVYGIATYRSR